MRERVAKAGAHKAAHALQGTPTLVGTPKQPKQDGQAWAFLKWPLITSVAPAGGPTAGGTEVTVTGENFTRCLVTRPARPALAGHHRRRDVVRLPDDPPVEVGIRFF
jgi:hypothetical protein